jgi:ribonuclease HI
MSHSCAHVRWATGTGFRPDTQCKGHSGDPMNDMVDRLAVEAAASQAGLAE